MGEMSRNQLSGTLDEDIEVNGECVVYHGFVVKTGISIEQATDQRETKPVLFFD
jgi:hypothetical protein